VPELQVIVPHAKSWPPELPLLLPELPELPLLLPELPELPLLLPDPPELPPLLLPELPELPLLLPDPLELLEPPEPEPGLLEPHAAARTTDAKPRTNPPTTA